MRLRGAWFSTHSICVKFGDFEARGFVAFFKSRRVDTWYSWPGRSLVNENPGFRAPGQIVILLLQDRETIGKQGLQRKQALVFYTLDFFL